MIHRLDYGEEEGDVRGKLDQVLEVSAWRSPGRHVELPDRKVDIDGDEFTAPSWWHGDEDASQSFLASMGVTIE
jgi:hypothetical protein